MYYHPTQWEDLMRYLPFDLTIVTSAYFVTRHKAVLGEKLYIEHGLTTTDSSHLISSQSLNLGGRRGTTDDGATIPFHPSLSSTALRNLQTPFPSIP